MPPRTRRPIWLATPTRYAGLSRRTARMAIGGLVVLLLLAILVALHATPPVPMTSDGPADITLYQGIVEGIRHGGSYYGVTADALRTGGYPLHPFATFRLPVLAVVQASLPLWAGATLLYVLAAGTFLAWHGRILPALPHRPARATALILLGGGMIVHLQAPMLWYHEVWAGLLVALSLGLRHRGRWIEAVAVAVAAMLIRETAALYVVLMAGFALAEGERREAAGWGAAIGVLAVAMAAHAYAVAPIIGPLDPVSPGWDGALLPTFGVRALAMSSALAILPLALAAPLVVLALLGWSAWASPLATRTLAMLGCYAILLALFARADSVYWGLMATPALLIGLAFVPDALRDLIAAAIDTRRITVTRVTR